MSSSLYFWKIELGLGNQQYNLQKMIAFTYIPKPENDSTLFTVFTHTHAHTHTHIYIYIYTHTYLQLATSCGAMDSEDEELEVDPGVPFDHGEDYTQSEIDEWPDLEPWHPSWVGMSPSAIAHRIEQMKLKRMDRKVLHRIRHNKAFKVRCSNQLHLDQLLEKIRIKGGNDAMQPENESERSDDDFW